MNVGRRAPISADHSSATCVSAAPLCCQGAVWRAFRVAVFRVVVGAASVVGAVREVADPKCRCAGVSRRIWVVAAMWIMWFIRRSPARGRRWRTTSAEAVPAGGSPPDLVRLPALRYRRAQRADCR